MVAKPNWRCLLEPGIIQRMQEEYRVLIVDDDPEILELVKGFLGRSGMVAITAQSVLEAEEIIAAESIDLVVLDLMMPGEDGLSFCRRLHTKSSIPVIMLTALSEDVDRIVGLEVGADDYLGKPFNPRELLARIKAVMRRSEMQANASPAITRRALKFGPYILLPEQLALKHKDGRNIDLTSGEFAVLLALAERAPRVLSRDLLLDLSRGVQTNPFDRSIDSQVSRIRRKMEVDPRKPQYIKTVRNLGYALSANVEREEV
ncbi:MAG: response regulator [Pseudomonadota bacterium]